MGCTSNRHKNAVHFCILLSTLYSAWHEVYLGVQCSIEVAELVRAVLQLCKLLPEDLQAECLQDVTEYSELPPSAVFEGLILPSQN